MTTPARTLAVNRDDEHNAFVLAVEDRSQGYPRSYTIGVDFITSGEYRTLLAAYREIRDIKFPVTVKASGAHEETAPEDEGGASVDGSGTADGSPEPARQIADAKTLGPARARKESDATFDDVDAFVEFFIVAGKKGVAVNRYKGLGEMNPETLWATTMDPEVRTLLQVRAEDHAEADQMFTTLMGDQVEPRRKFIEDNALDVRNLDV
jgi:DNA gyrase subunit B